jgi:transposase
MEREPTMRSSPWHPPVDPAPAERATVERIRPAKLFVFLRRQRHAIFTNAFHAELGAVNKDGPAGSPPMPPGGLALATILQAYTGVSDDGVFEATTMDRRWQLVLAYLDCAEPPFSTGTSVTFRRRTIERNWDWRPIEQTIAAAEQTGEWRSRDGWRSIPRPGRDD